MNPFSFSELWTLFHFWKYEPSELWTLFHFRNYEPLFIFGIMNPFSFLEIRTFGIMNPISFSELWTLGNMNPNSFSELWSFGITNLRNNATIFRNYEPLGMGNLCFGIMNLGNTNLRKNEPPRRPAIVKSNIKSILVFVKHLQCCQI